MLYITITKSHLDFSNKLHSVQSNAHIKALNIAINHSCDKKASKLSDIPCKTVRIFKYHNNED